jgi:hypothetical protein
VLSYCLTAAFSTNGRSSVEFIHSQRMMLKGLTDNSKRWKAFEGCLKKSNKKDVIDRRKDVVTVVLFVIQVSMDCDLAKWWKILCCQVDQHNLFSPSINRRMAAEPEENIGKRAEKISAREKKTIRPTFGTLSRNFANKYR